MEWTLDKAHSSIEFRVKHMGLAAVRGSFSDFDLEFEADADGVPTHLEARINAASISTGEEQRDAHLRSADFLEADTHPHIRFVSTDIQDLGNGDYRLTGDLTMRGQTHPVTFDFELAKPITDPYGLRRVAAEAEGKINRKQWGLTWNSVLEAGALLVGEDVRFTIALEASAPQPTENASKDGAYAAA